MLKESQAKSRRKTFKTFKVNMHCIYAPIFDVNFCLYYVNFEFFLEFQTSNYGDLSRLFGKFSGNRSARIWDVQGNCSFSQLKNFTVLEISLHVL